MDWDNPTEEYEEDGHTIKIYEHDDPQEGMGGLAGVIIAYTFLVSSSSDPGSILFAGACETLADAKRMITERIALNKGV